MKTVYTRGDVVPLLAEIFRELGYEGTTLARITARTSLGKGSLYHFFPGGKEEMATAVLTEIDAWFETEIYVPLRRDDAGLAIDAMWTNVDRYFHSGGRVCLVGALALDGSRDLFQTQIQSYFARWVTALSDAVSRAGVTDDMAYELAEEAVLGIQGALVLSRALDDRQVFSRAIARQRTSLLAQVASAMTSRTAL